MLTVVVADFEQYDEDTRSVLITSPSSRRLGRSTCGLGRVRLPLTITTGLWIEASLFPPGEKVRGFGFMADRQCCVGTSRS